MSGLGHGVGSTMARLRLCALVVAKRAAQAVRRVIGEKSEGGPIMTVFSVAALQLELNQGDNVEEICAEVRAAKRRFSWLNMIVFGELAARGAKIEEIGRAHV